MNRKLIIVGNAHWSVRGSLDSDLWNWGLEIDDVFVTENNYLEQQTVAAKNFYNEIKLYLPSPRINCDMVYDGGIPGGTWIFKVPLERTTIPIEVEKILRRYFPDAFEGD